LLVTDRANWSARSYLYRCCLEEHDSACCTCSLTQNWIITKFVCMSSATSSYSL